MYVFMLLSLALCTMVQSASPYLKLVEPAYIAYAGIAFTVVGMAGAMFAKTGDKIWHDVFASGTLLAWFGFWRPLFKEDAAIFFFFPVYFMLLAAFFELFVFNKQYSFDKETLAELNAMVKHPLAQPWLATALVAGSLAMTEHYLTYPITITVLMLRLALVNCFKKG